MSSVNHPSHYADKCSIECIDAMLLIFDKREVIDFCVLNAFKYLWRWESKGGLEDLNKAEWYLNYIADFSKSMQYRDSVACSKISRLLKILSKAKEKVENESISDNDK